MPISKIPGAGLETTGTASVNTFLRGDNAWAGTITSGTAVTASGTSIDFTGIPSTAKRITVMFSGVSTNGTSNQLIQIGDSGGIEATSYSATSTNQSGTVASYTSGFGINNASGAVALHGVITIVLLAASTNTWALHGVISIAASGGSYYIAGSKALSDALTQVRITTVNGTDTFDAGTINIMWES